jgi:hypothetical protein
VTKALERERESGITKQKAVANSVKAESDTIIDCTATLCSPFESMESWKRLTSEIAKRSAHHLILANCFKLRRALGFDNPDSSLVNAFSKRESRLNE